MELRGAVQGVGFRPFVYRLATELGLKGWTSNSVTGLQIEVEGFRPVLEVFHRRLLSESPAQSVIHELAVSWLEPVGYRTFEIQESARGGEKSALVLPDIATCPECLNEIFDDKNRRFRYPFTNCTHCGPRFTIIEALPYDRANTSMRGFEMCPDCAREYNDPNNRRFHAQPNACPVCGPALELWNGSGAKLARENAALEGAALGLRQGSIVAVKGLGGFQLMAAAHLDQSAGRLRELKHREEKPFALMFPSLDLVKRACEVSSLEEELLLCAQAPIVLLRRRHGARSDADAILSPAVAPGNPYLGVMLPYTPLHHLLMRQLGFPLVATSGNLSEEPICIDNHEAVQRLSGLADLFLVHNRPIVRHADDSIVRVIADRATVLRRARGYAPSPILLTQPAGTNFERSGTSADLIRHGPGSAGISGLDTRTVISVGGHLKNTVALAVGPQVFISQHIGDLETAQAFQAFERVVADFQSFYETTPACIVADAHPDYLSTQFAKRTGLPLIQVQHHLAHVFACLAEHGLANDALGVSWDGTGFGMDGTIWGGEFLTVTSGCARRLGHLRTFRLPGAEKAVREPRRSAIGVLYELFGDEAFEMTELAPIRSSSPAELRVFQRMLERKVNSPQTSSAGRLFDAVAALMGIRQRTTFEGQAAMELEWASEGEYLPGASALTAQDSALCLIAPSLAQSGTGLVLDWAPLIRQVLDDMRNHLPPARISRTFHNSVVEGIVKIAQAENKKVIVLTGGCFQNKYLTERAVARLREEGFRPCWHERIPPNDGGISLGQIAAARGCNRTGS